MNSLTHSIKKILKEVDTTHKQTIGRGAEHVIYPSQKHPDRVYKIGKQESVEQWLDIFRENPEIFPKVFGVGYFKNKPEIKFVEIEKLNTDEVKNEWGILDFALEDLGVQDEFGYVDDIFYMKSLGKWDDKEILKSLKKQNPRAYNLYKKWSDYLEKIDTYLKSKGYKYFDIHRHNFGYDKNGKIKTLDI